LSNRVIALIRLPGKLPLTRSRTAISDEVAKQAVAGTSTGRFTHPQEVADLVVLLARGDRAATSPTPTPTSSSPES
jgi:NAD(P)-dependent dehydrogenase (short-subunit alcohol dehydrogenase family)